MAVKKRTYLGERRYEGLFAVGKAAAEGHARRYGWRVTKEDIEEAVGDALLEVMMSYCVKDGVFVGAKEGMREAMERDMARLAIAYLDKERRRRQREFVFSDLIDEGDEDKENGEIEVELNVTIGPVTRFCNEENAWWIYQFLESIVNSRARDERRRKALLRCLKAVYDFSTLSRPFDLTELPDFVGQKCNISEIGARKLLAQLQDFLAPYYNDAEVVYLIAPILSSGGENDDD